MKTMLRTLMLAFARALPQAHAGLVSTDDAQVGRERERVKALLERPELAREIEKLGILPHQAVERVDAMNDAEVRQLAGRLDALPAGGDTNQTLILLIVLVVLLVILL